MTSKTKKIIKQIAMQNGVTPEFVEEEMRKAMQAGIHVFEINCKFITIFNKKTEVQPTP